MSPETVLPIRLTSEGPHALTFTVERAGRDLLCRVHGGEVHIGATALSEWRDGRAHTRCLSVEGHKEEAIARHAAHTLCGAVRCTVACVAGIHFDGISRADIEAISAAAYALARQAAESLRDERLLAELSPVGGVYDCITSRRAEYVETLEELFSIPVQTALDTHAEEIDASRARNFGQDVRIFAPLYLSNACTNDCVYCGFRRSSSYDRTRLSLEQAVTEANELTERGIRAVDLVTGEIPADPFVDYVCEVTAALLERTDITRVHLNLGALSTEQYGRRRLAGAAGYHLYQETYDPEAYFRVHRSGAKREMAFRLEAPRRVADAGFPYIGLEYCSDWGAGDTTWPASPRTLCSCEKPTPGSASVSRCRGCRRWRRTLTMPRLVRCRTTTSCEPCCSCVSRIRRPTSPSPRANGLRFGTCCCAMA